MDPVKKKETNLIEYIMSQLDEKYNTKSVYGDTYFHIDTDIVFEEFACTDPMFLEKQDIGRLQIHNGEDVKSGDHLVTRDIQKDTQELKKILVEARQLSKKYQTLKRHFETHLTEAVNQRTQEHPEWTKKALQHMDDDRARRAQRLVKKRKTGRPKKPKVVKQ